MAKAKGKELSIVRFGILDLVYDPQRQPVMCLSGPSVQSISTYNLLDEYRPIFKP